MAHLDNASNVLDEIISGAITPTPAIVAGLQEIKEKLPHALARCRVG